MKQSHYYGGGAWSRRASKQKWAPPSIADVVNPHLSYYERQPGAALFYERAHKIQRRAAQLAGSPAGESFEPQSKVQLAPLYGTWPRLPGALAALGWTAFLEYRGRIPGTPLVDRVSEIDVALNGCDPAAFLSSAKIVAAEIELVIFLGELLANRDLDCLEVHRLLLADQFGVQMNTLRQIARPVIVFGDILKVDPATLHPTTAEIYGAIVRASGPFFEHLPGPVDLDFGMEWLSDIMAELTPFLPRESHEPHKASSAEPGFRLPRIAQSSQRLPRIDEEIGPLDAPQPPVIDDPASSVEQLTQQLSSAGAQNGEQPEDFFKEFAEAVQSAGGQTSSYADMRSDIVEQEIANSGFQAGPIEGTASEGHEVSVDLGSQGVAKGEIFDRAVPPSDDPKAVDELAQEFDAFGRLLEKNLYPNVEQVPERNRYQTSGSLDPSRLPFFAFKDNIYRRPKVHEKPNPEGKATLVVACDASGSLSRPQMRLAKGLTYGFLKATTKGDIQTLAAIYHSGVVRKGASHCPLVQWLYHPRKTPSLNKHDALRSLANTPDAGTGSQSDALSLQLILDEAKKVARGSTVYLVLITDLAWNSSFHLPGSNGAQEVESVLESAYEGPMRLNTTLVGVGKSGLTGFEEVVDKVVLVSQAELSDYVAVAEKIGRYVASCIQDRRRWISRQ